MPQNRSRPRRRALHPSRSGPPLRQSSLRHLQNARNRQSRHLNSRLLPRNRRRRQSRRHRRSPGPPNPAAIAEVMRRHGLTRLRKLRVALVATSNLQGIGHNMRLLFTSSLVILPAFAIHHPSINCHRLQILR
jgi:hypothetical protein